MWTPIASVGAGSGANGATTGAIDTTGADLIVAVVGSYLSGPSVTVSDSKGNTWTALTNYQNGSGEGRERMFYCRPTSVGSGHTFTVAGTSSYASISVGAFSGSIASPFDQQSGAGTTSVNTIAPGSITPTEPGELIISGLGTNGQSHSIDSGFTLYATVNTVGVVTYYGSALAYKIQTSAVAVNPTWTSTPDGAWGAGKGHVAAIASFKGVAPPPSVGGRMLAVF